VAKGTGMACETPTLLTSTPIGVPLEMEADKCSQPACDASEKSRMRSSILALGEARAAEEGEERVMG
jgi:hypothetical protein